MTARRKKPFEAEFNAALSLWHDGEREQAVAALRRLVELDPNEPTIQGMLGGYLHELGDLEEALRHTSRGVELSPGSELAARTHFHVLYELGRYSESLAELRRFLAHAETPAAREEWQSLIREVESERPG